MLVGTCDGICCCIGRWIRSSSSRVGSQTMPDGRARDEGSPMTEAGSFFETRNGKIVGGVVVALAIASGVYFARDMFSSPMTEANERVFIDSATGKTFPFELSIGDTIPVKAPSGSQTGYPAEKCFWSADGSPKSEPTFVLTEEAKGNPGPSFCPDCGRLVVPHNPPPTEGRKPPPLKSEYEARRSRESR